MDSFWYRLLVRWYRLTGSTQVQAEWKARQAVQAPGATKERVTGAVDRAKDQRFNCVCGQLLVVGDKTCHACGRRQWGPHWLRSLSRLGRDFLPGGSPITVLCGGLMLLGYLAQIRYGGGGIMNPSDGQQAGMLGAFFSPLAGVQPWRAVTYAFLHGGLWHIAFNLYALTILGPMVEREFGPGRTLAAWVLTGAAAVLVPHLFFPRFIVGASGAVFGFIGMAAWWGHRAGTTEGKMVRDTMLRWAIYTTLFGLMIGHVAHDAHFVGMAAGAVFAMVCPPPKPRTHPAIGVLLGLLALAALAWALISWGLWLQAAA